MAKTNTEQKKKTGSSYVAQVNISGPNGERYEQGDKVPSALVEEHAWLLEQGKVK